MSSPFNKSFLLSSAPKISNKIEEPDMKYPAVQMSQEQQRLATISAQASTLFERQDREHHTSAQLSNHALQTRLQRLYTNLGSPDDETKQHFLARYQLDEQQLASRLSSQEINDTWTRPDWIKQLEQVLSEYAVTQEEETSSSYSDHSLSSDEPIPFEELLLPFIRFARHQLSQSALMPCSLLTDEVQVTLEHWLLSSLSQWASSALQLEFSHFRRRRFWSRASLVGQPRRHIYEAFLLQYQGQKLLSFFGEYSLLARVLMLQVEQWLAACGEFVQRLQADLEEITYLFHAGQPLGNVIKLIPGRSDPHHGGRSVFLLKFAAGLKLVYKPRSLELDQAFFALLSWCHASGLTPGLKTLQVLSRPTHGWMEYVEQLPCANSQQVHSYYQRSGMLLGLLYVLGGTDIHYENLVACGEHPVIIDLEMAVSPGYSPLLQYKTASNYLTQPGALLEQTVLNSGLLPARTSLKDIKRAFDLSGLGGMDEPESEDMAIQWQHINTDAMSRQQTTDTEQAAAEPELNCVMQQETKVSPYAYSEEIVTGFEQTYRFLLAHRQELLAPEGPLAAFFDCPLRIVLRKTQTYAKILERLQHPKFLHDDCDRWIELQILKRPLPTALAEPRLWGLAEAEIASLEQLDIPWFGTRVNSHDLQTDSGQTIPDVFPVTAQERIHSSLNHLNECDLQRQTNLIRASFQAASSAQVEEEELPTLAEELEAQKALSSNELLEVARQIGLELCAQAFPFAQGNKGWIGFHFQPDLKYYSLQPVDFNLYDGTCGIALFLGALGSVTGEETFSTCAASALQLLCQHIRAAASPVLDSVGTGQAQSAQQLKQWGIGGASGLGSILYALTRLGTWLQQPELLEVARQAASLITTSRIHEDKSFDIIAGSAGAILGLLTLYKQTGEETLLERALLCGNHLLEQRIQTESGARSWATIEKESPLTGFSHGAAGIAYALLLLSQATEQHVFKDAAEEALRFEQHLFCPEVGNWLDLRKPEAPTEAETEPKFMVSWCHGAPGIGLARLGGLPILDTPQVRNEIQAALQTTLASGLSSLDKLCCGNFGGIELLVAASGRLEQPHLLQVAQQWTSALVHRATQRGGFHVLDQLPRQAFNPGFFQGHAGVGYQLLRVAFPERIPSVLLWE
jgi:type 2 lantibiotic biosynthesis protein LanM